MNFRVPTLSKPGERRTSFAGHPADDWRLVLAALTLLVRIRVGLSLSTLKVVQARLPGLAQAGRAERAHSPAKVARYVALAAWLVPGASCLTQALACQVLLQRNRVASSVAVGVRRTSKGLAAHAWVVVEGRVALGGTTETLGEFSPIAEFGPLPQ